MARVLVELELRSMEDGSEHDFSYFHQELKELFENFGWKLLKTSYDDIEIEEDEDEVSDE